MKSRIISNRELKQVRETPFDIYGYQGMGYTLGELYRKLTRDVLSVESLNENENLHLFLRPETIRDFRAGHLNDVFNRISSSAYLLDHQTRQRPQAQYEKALLVTKSVLSQDSSTGSLYSEVLDEISEDLRLFKDPSARKPRYLTQRDLVMSLAL